MDINEIINLVTNNGIGIVCVAYLIYFQSTTQTEIQKTLVEISKTMQTIAERLSILEDKIGK